MWKTSENVEFPPLQEASYNVDSNITSKIPQNCRSEECEVDDVYNEEGAYKLTEQQAKLSATNLHLHEGSSDVYSWPSSYSFARSESTTDQRELEQFDQDTLSNFATNQTLPESVTFSQNSFNSTKKYRCFDDKRKSEITSDFCKSENFENFVDSSTSAIATTNDGSPKFQNLDFAVKYHQQALEQENNYFEKDSNLTSEFPHSTTNNLAVVPFYTNSNCQQSNEFHALTGLTSSATEDVRYPYQNRTGVIVDDRLNNITFSANENQNTFTEEDFWTRENMNYLTPHPNSAITSTIPVQMHPGHNGYPGSMRPYAGVESERTFVQNGRENSRIKFRIRTFTDCEVECPAPGTIPFGNRPAPYLINGVTAMQVPQSNNQKQQRIVTNNFEKNSSSAPVEQANNFWLQHFQSSDPVTASSANQDIADQYVPNSSVAYDKIQDKTSELQDQKGGETESRIPNQILGENLVYKQDPEKRDKNAIHHLAPTQGGFNTFPNEPRRLLLHEQRQTSILIGYPMNDAGSSANEFNAVAANTGSQQIASLGTKSIKRSTSVSEQMYPHNSDPSMRNCNELPSLNAQDPNNTDLKDDTAVTYQSASQNSGPEESFLSNTCPTTNPTIGSERIDKQYGKIYQDFTPSNVPIQPIADHVTLRTSYTPMIGFPSHPFSGLPQPAPTWITSQQTFATCPTQDGLFESIPMSQSLQFNNNSTIGFISNNYAYVNGQDKTTNGNNVPHAVPHAPKMWPSSKNFRQENVPKASRIQQKKSRSVRSSSKQSENKKFVCTERDCTKRFSKEKELEVHINKYHLHLIKPYFCKYCRPSKSFKRPDQLKRHEKIHTGEKPHICKICFRAFARTDHRNTHYKKHDSAERNRKYPSNGELLALKQKALLSTEDGGKKDQLSNGNIGFSKPNETHVANGDENFNSPRPNVIFSGQAAKWPSQQYAIQSLPMYEDPYSQAYATNRS